MPPNLVMEEWFAQTYTWPADVTRRQPTEVADWFPIIHAAKMEVQRMREREAERKQKSR